jgi:hypothetical protein
MKAMKAAAPAKKAMKVKKVMKAAPAAMKAMKVKKVDLPVVMKAMKVKRCEPPVLNIRRRWKAGVLTRSGGAEDLTACEDEDVIVSEGRHVLTFEPAVKIFVDDSWSEEQLHRRVMIHMPDDVLDDTWVSVNIGELIREQIPITFSEALGCRLEALIHKPAYDIEWQ